LVPGPRAKLLVQAKDDTTHHFTLLSLLAKLASALAEASITWVLVKSPVLTELVHQGSSRGQLDLDLVGAGATVADRNWGHQHSRRTSLIILGTGTTTISVARQRFLHTP